MTSSVYVSTPGALQGSRHRPASVHAVDHYEEIPVDVAPPTSGAGRLRASVDDLRSRPQPPIPADLGQGEGDRGQRSTSGQPSVVDSMTRKPSYDNNDVILIDSAIYG